MLQVFFTWCFGVFLCVFTSHAICLLAGHNEAVTAHAHTPTKPEVQTCALVSVTIREWEFNPMWIRWECWLPSGGGRRVGAAVRPASVFHDLSKSELIAAVNLKS